ncbi:hypothetical protein [Sandaracinus amylolyticus]|uniref:Uncharacterized protein n=1 Tax=Sandaracinus amylolyticus TaxID=927083 RepID=A0A0F6YNT8_9BACT|nr:hypothetical protein [Sandaracinus amylolyticus]AKF10722.1 hypothetical protein DB32_007871 [Sandaracinus amylolyticus]
MKRSTFAQRLAETIAWCAPRAGIGDPRRSLRDPQLQPQLLARDRAQTVAWLVSRRDRRVRGEPIPPSTRPASGRLLVYFPDANLSCGAAELETDGFFDADNVPPWDTWISVHDRAHGCPSYGSMLVCWVPPALVELVDRGIDVNPEQCIVWIDALELDLDALWRAEVD